MSLRLLGKNKLQKCADALVNIDNIMQRRNWNEAKNLITLALDVAYDSQSLLQKRALCHMNLKEYHDVLMDTRRILQKDKTICKLQYNSNCVWKPEKFI